ncbi:hypothetical protein LRE75_29440 [Streptomyces sp. 372A]
MRLILCPLQTCSRSLFAQPDGTFACQQAHAVDPDTITLRPDDMWLPTPDGQLFCISTPAASLRRMLDADREYTDAPMEYDLELPPLLELKDAAFELVEALDLGLPFPAASAR